MEAEFDSEFTASISRCNVNRFYPEQRAILSSAGNRLDVQLTIAHDSQPADSFGDQDTSVWKEDKSVRVAEASQGDNTEFRPGNLVPARTASAAIKYQRQPRDRDLPPPSSLRLRPAVRNEAAAEERYKKTIRRPRFENGIVSRAALCVRLEPQRGRSDT